MRNHNAGWKENHQSEKTRITKLVLAIYFFMVSNIKQQDEDDGQTAGSFGRTIAKVTCKENKVLNSELLVAGMAVIDTRFCGKSEFTGENWAKINGCE